MPSGQRTSLHEFARALIEEGVRLLRGLVVLGEIDVGPNRKRGADDPGHDLQGLGVGLVGHGPFRSPRSAGFVVCDFGFSWA